MRRNRKSGNKKLLICFVQLAFFALSASQTMVFADTPPERCIGYGNVQVISLQNWEAGLGSWTASTNSVANPATFSTPDWAVVGSLPDGRPGLAAFVADLNSDCAVDGSGVLRLNSPTISIPSGAPVPRISINHFFDTELGWDGGNLRISVNGGNFNLVPASAVEFNYFNDTLLPALDNEGFEYNTNPLADQPAYTGTIDGQPDGSWVETRINLLGIADAGDNVRLRFNFGVDTCFGEVGWYVDEVEVYNCEAELAPSDCGNGVIDAGEQCDDGNNFIGDGCSNVCQIDEGWQCSAPTPAGFIPDYSFEDGRNNQYWTEVSNNTLGSPICDVATCNTGGGSGASDGTYWVWIGGSRSYREESVTQSVVIPSTVSELTFDLEIPACDSVSDYFEVLIDGNQELLVNGSSPLCGIDGYTSQSVDISAYANDGSHSLAFHGETLSANGGISNFFIDNVEMPLTPSICRSADKIFSDGFE